MRIATSVSTYPFFNFRYLKLMDELAKRFEFYCFAGSSFPSKVGQAATRAKVIHVLPFKIPRRISYRIGPLVSSMWINAVQPDVVWLFDTAGPMLPLMFEKPVVLDAEDPYILLPGNKSRLKTLNEFRLLREKSVEAIVVTTEIIRRKFIKLGIEPKKIHVIPYGVDVRLFQPSPLPKEPLVLYYGTFQEHRARLLAEVVEHTCRMDAEVKFLLVGDVPAWFKHRMRRMGCRDRAQMPGFIPHDELPKWMEKARICLLPQDRSLGGRLSFKLLEYMAAGRPVVATDVEESFPVRESGAGVVVPVDAKAMAEAIVELLRDSKAAEEMARKGIHYSRKYDWELMVRKYVALFEGLS
ncbi:MAG: glycosyltransferase family 4 protein [Candidatus Caldarchaeum sp.]|nr:glycosyltransferase family 4 protein [Candidatus Caldarchaeum sp.]